VLRDRGSEVLETTVFVLEHQVAAIIAKQERNSLNWITICNRVTYFASRKVGCNMRAFDARQPPVVFERVSERQEKGTSQIWYSSIQSPRQPNRRKANRETGWKPVLFTDRLSIVDGEQLKGYLTQKL
jgi:hypothetical protein